MKYVLTLLGLLMPFASHAHSVPADRLAILSRGANLEYIFQRRSDLSLDLQKLNVAGFRHVRNFVDEGRLNEPDYLARMDRLVNAAADLKMGVILVMMSKQHPFADDTDVELRWTEAWQQLAKRYRHIAPQYFYPEIANEPNITSATWDAIQERLRQTLRTILPQHTLLLTGSPLSMVHSLPPLSADSNVVYTWHLYQPMLFTHQGTDWTSYGPLKGLAFPPEHHNIERLKAVHPEMTERLSYYEKSGGKLMNAEIAKSRAWAAQHQAAVMVTEFGVFTSAPGDSRARWLKRAREQLEDAHEGWTVWEYEGGFGIIPLIPGSPILDALLG